MRYKLLEGTHAGPDVDSPGSSKIYHAKTPGQDVIESDEDLCLLNCPGGSPKFRRLAEGESVAHSNREAVLANMEKVKAEQEAQEEHAEKLKATQPLKDADDAAEAFQPKAKVSAKVPTKVEHHPTLAKHSATPHPKSK